MMSAKWYFLWCHLLSCTGEFKNSKKLKILRGKFLLLLFFQSGKDCMKEFLLFWIFFRRYSANTLSSVELELQMQSSMRERNLKLGETRWEGLHMVLMLVNLLTFMGKEAVCVSSLSAGLVIWRPWAQVQPLQVVGFVLASPEFKFLAMFAKLLTGLPTTGWNF